MADPVVEFQFDANWDLVYSEGKSVQYINAFNWVPIEAWEVSLLFSNYILAMRTVSLTAKATWRYAGRLYQRLQIGSGGAGSTLPIVDFSVRSLRLNATTLVDLSRYTPEYRLVFSPPYWLQDITLEIYEYTGVDSDNVTELLLQQQSDLERMEQKIDALSGGP